MRNIKIILIISCILSVSPSLLFAQKNSLKAGDKAFSEGDFYGAVVNYRKALDADSSKLEVLYKFAEACRLNNDYRPAERYYKIVFSKDKTVPALFPLSQFWYASMLKYNGKYAEAKKAFKQYSSKNKASQEYPALKAKWEITACDAAIALSKTVDSNVVISHMDTSVNSQFSEIAPFQLGDTIFYFSSMRTEFTIKDPKEKEGVNLKLAQIYKSYRRGDSIWANTKTLTPMFNAPEMNNSNCVFSSDAKRFYFTRSKPTMNSEGKSEIYVCELKNNRWQPGVRLNDPVNMAGYNTTQPFLVSNGKKGDFMYFASDRPGGKGKFDIYVCTVSPDGKYSQPVNLGEKINTPDNDVTPCFHAKTQTLYFSSEWHKGLGGFDIFKSVKSGASWSDPQNLGFPINTSTNDLYFHLTTNGRDGYFASNRVGTISNKGETCCNDIYFVIFKDVQAKLDSLKQLEENYRLAALDLDKATPITLYFDNDAPDPHSEESTTTLDYETTARDYMSLRKDYELEYTKGLSGKTKDNALKDINDLFDKYINNGLEKLERFCNLLVPTLQSGRSVKMTIKGFTSPLAEDDYNLKLAERRVKSLINYIKEFKYSTFEKYLNGTAENGASLTIVEEAIGEAQASKEVTDNPNDQRNAVYSRAAALERKIEIMDVVISAPPVKKK